MISHVKRTDIHSVAKDAEDNRFEQIRKAAAEKRRKSETDGTKCRDRRMTANNRLLWRSTSCHNIKRGRGSIN